jgi:ABC-type sugar transport system ATPase subunit
MTQEAAPPLELRGISKSFGGVAALSDVDFALRAGEIHGLVGENGAGKSTLMKIIAGVHSQYDGRMTIDGRRVYFRSARDALAAGIGMVHQELSVVPDLTVAENVMLPMDFCGLYPARERRARAELLLEQVGMLEHARKLPSAVSGGQQQRAAIARAMANDPPLLITDEPTGNLDSRTAEAVFELFEGLVRRGRTVLIVTHDEDLARRAGRVAVIADGQLLQGQQLAREHSGPGASPR